LAGKPRVKRVIEDLTALAVAELDGEIDEPTALDYAVHWHEGGGTMIGLALKLQNESAAGKLGAYDPILDAGGLARMLRRRFDSATVDEVLGRARARGSIAQVEQTHVIADEAVTSSEDAARARNRIGTRQWAAERLDRGTFGQQRGPSVAVQINMGQAHIDALRRRVVPTTVPAQMQSLQSGDVTDAEVIVTVADELDVAIE
jgi:hypothetical protein